MNGSVALDVAVADLRIGPDDEVISFAQGATPVGVDSEPLTWNMDVRQIESRITSRSTAIIVVHFMGCRSTWNPSSKLLAVTAFALGQCGTSR